MLTRQKPPYGAQCDRKLVGLERFWREIVLNTQEERTLTYFEGERPEKLICLRRGYSH